MAKPDGGPAYPLPFVMREDRKGYTEMVSATDYGIGGMSLRDYFAGQALAGVLAKSSTDGGRFSKPEGVARAASFSYEYADAMLAEREK